MDQSDLLHPGTLLEGSLPRSYPAGMYRIMFPLLAMLAALLTPGCATNDYTRITTKIAAYDTEAATAKATLARAKTDAEKMLAYRTLISLSEKQLMIARRISPNTNPGVRAGSMTVQQSKDDCSKRISELETQLKAYQAEFAKLSGRSAGGV